MSKPRGVSYCGISSDETCLRTERHPALRWPESVRRQLCGTWEPGAAMRTDNSKWWATRMRVRKRLWADGWQTRTTRLAPGHDETGHLGASRPRDPFSANLRSSPAEGLVT